MPNNLIPRPGRGSGTITSVVGALDKVGVTVVPFNTEGLLELVGILDTVGIRVPFNEAEVGALDVVGDKVPFNAEGMLEGFDDGMPEGMLEGLDDGMLEGLVDGAMEGKLEGTALIVGEPEGIFTLVGEDDVDGDKLGDSLGRSLGEAVAFATVGCRLTVGDNVPLGGDGAGAVPLKKIGVTQYKS